MIFEVGKPFPGPVPGQEGCIMEMSSDGSLFCMIQLPGLSRPEKQAFKKTFKRYGYLESGTEPPIAFWIWDFPGPMNEMDCNFNGAIVPGGIVDAYLAPEDGLVKNMITFYLLDGNILQGIKIVGLEPDAVRLFHVTIRKQRAGEWTVGQYDRALGAMYAYSTKEMFDMSVRFKM